MVPQEEIDAKMIELDGTDNKSKLGANGILAVSLAVARAEKAKEAHLRKIAANMAREVRLFWANAQKLFEWQVRQQLEKKRKEALDQHLNFIVDKTEKYSTLLAESLAESANVSGQVSFRET